MAESVEKMDGKWKKWGIREGDRVCVVGAKEREKGKIGVVREVKEKAESCKVQGINMVCASAVFLSLVKEVRLSKIGTDMEIRRSISPHQIS